VACFEVLVASDTCDESEGAVLRQGHLIAVVGTFLLGCAFLLLAVGCSGTRSGTSNKKEKGSSPKATVSKEEARCDGTRSLDRPHGTYLTNDVPGCPKGGLLRGTDGPDSLYGGDGDDTIRALGGKDHILGGPGNNVIYGGPGGEGVLDGDEGDDVIYGGSGVDYINGKEGEDVIYGGDGNDWLSGGNDEQRDKFYCGAGKDHYYADKNDYVSSSCEKKIVGGGAA
jgi:hypothetical protein